MNREDVKKHFNIPPEILEEYHEMGLCKEVKKVMGTWQYDDSDVERLGLIMTLHDVGLTNDEVAYFMQLETKGSKTEAERRKILDEKRASRLDEIHFKEKQLDCLDYLRQKINEQEK